MNGRADFLVSGDGDMLALHPFKSIQILTPSDFLASYRETKRKKSLEIGLAKKLQAPARIGVSLEGELRS